MFTEKTITVAARCCECCNEIKTELSIFSLSGGKISAKCPNCGGSSLDISLSCDGKIRLSVPCVACPHPHPFTLSAESVFTKELFILQCSFTRLDICFIGNRKSVNEQLKKNGEELYEMMSDGEAVDEDGNPMATLEQMKVILQFIEDCAKNGKILCRCKNMKNATAVDMQVGNDFVSVTCRDCGRTAIIYADDTDFLDKLMDLGLIPLDDD